MSRSPQRVIPLQEYVPQELGREELSEAEAKALWLNYSRQIAVEAPSFKTGQKWRLTAQGWVGHIPLTPELGLALQPKVELANLFRMLEYAYNLQSFRFLEGLIDCRSLDEYYERLANILAKRILDRNRKGLYRTYLAETERLPYVRGRLDLRQSLGRPGQVRLRCHYEEHTADIEENQILAWTLFGIARSGMCSEDRALPTVRRAYRALRGLVTLTPHEARACRGRLYNRLNDDYQPLHALCSFFLEQSGPAHEFGEHAMLPFLVDMARLYERFVAEWLKSHLPNRWQLKVQESVDVDPIRAVIDLVVMDTNTGEIQCVLDTKYKKILDTPANEDIYQVVAYAKARKSRQAVLIYPQPLQQPLDIWWDDIRVRSLTFSLAGDLEQAGQEFLQSLGLDQW